MGRGLSAPGSRSQAQRKRLTKSPRRLSFPMPRFHFAVQRILLIALALLPFIPLAADEAVPDKIEFNRDMRPILSDTCFKCHGFDPKHREAKRRIDTREGALEDHDGVRAIMPGKPEES